MLGLVRIYSQNSSPEFHVKELKNMFKKTGCLENLIKGQVKKALRSTENVKEKGKQHIKGYGVPLLVNL